MKILIMILIVINISQSNNIISNEYNINSNRDVFNHNTYNSRDRNTFDYENEIPKINPKYILLILKKFANLVLF